MKAPLNIIPNEIIHQFRLVRLKKTSDCFGKDFFFIAKPSLLCQSDSTFIKILRYFSLYRFHLFLPPI